MPEMEVCHQLPHTDQHEGWPEKCGKVMRKCQIIGQISREHKTIGLVNTPRKGFSIYKDPSPPHTESPHLSSHPPNRDTDSNLNTCLSEKLKTTPIHGEVYRSSALCEKTGDEKYRMGPPLTHSVASASRHIYQGVIDHQDISKSKNSGGLREIPIFVEASTENQNQINKGNPLLHERASLFKPVKKSTAPVIGDVMTIKEGLQTVLAKGQPVSSNKTRSKTVEDYSAEKRTDFHPVSTPGTGAVEDRVVHGCLTKEQAVQPKPGAKLVHKQVQNMTPAERLDEYITVNGKGYRVLELLGRGGSSRVFRVS
jgi:hypothetical protein